MKQRSVKKKVINSSPVLKGYSLPEMAKHLPVSSQKLMFKRGQLMMDLRANPLEVYGKSKNELLTFLSVRERTAPLRASVKGIVLASLKPKRGSYFVNEKTLTQLVENINLMTENQLLDLLAKQGKVSSEEFRELVLATTPQNANQLKLKIKETKAKVPIAIV